MNRVNESQHFSVRQLLLVGLTAVFLVLLMYMVLGQASAVEQLNDRLVFFAMVMVLDEVLLILCVVYSWRTNTNFISFLCAIAILIGIASAYLLMFNSFFKQMWTTAAGLTLGCAVHFIWRKKNTLTDRAFYLCIGAIAILLAANFIFGEYENGARLRINLFGLFTFQPGELVKVVLLLLGACSYRNTKRSIYYCITALASCIALLLLRDMGGAVVIFAMFVFMTYLLFDNRILSLGIIGGALVVFIILLKFNSYAASRFSAWTHVMDLDSTWQQRNFIKVVLYGGFDGLGVANAFSNVLDLEYSKNLVNIYAISNDGALAGVMAVYGVPMALITLGAYAVLIVQPAYNRSVYPSNFLIMAQISILLFCQSMLNFCGALDMLPFTGLAAPLISQGGTSALTFGIMMGLEAAALCPAIETMTED